MKQTYYTSGWHYALLVSPIIFLIGLFFYVPVGLAFFWSFFLERPFGGGSEFIGFANYARLLGDTTFWSALHLSGIFMLLAAGFGVAIALILALAADRDLRLSGAARNIILWPKAIAGASIGVVFTFIFNPHLGLLAPLSTLFPGVWNPRMDGTQAFLMLVVAQVWHGLPFNFIILLAGLQSLPDTLIKAAAVDGAGPWRRILDIQIPLITPQLFLAFVLEFVGTLVDVFGLIDTMTQGGPGGSTTFLIYKIYKDGFVAYDLSGAATQTVLLMIFVIAMVLLQFRLEKRVRYER
ncbi:sn-glycerol-3-phosphate ABC transporter permease protein UgpA 1 (plasmid) [Rhizobium etli 8C-3]|uniref:sn-glycerol-3-phosphate transport system permease protein UgpA n=2 Tax=Rhizobium etli TaxID=29449 RepID=A0A1L5PAR8_RHIET|nr:sugar ABC transporter permease [Rhizobium etli]APO77203.1 sn-glycerol-3-phosphate ABC transporter permease protein UgpA 1 [Rhizobium etli 8C-3]